MVKATLSALLSLVTFSAGVGCSVAPSLSVAEALSYCEGRERTVAIDSSFSAARIEAIQEAVEAWETAAPEVSSFKIETTTSVTEMSPCTYLIVNAIPHHSSKSQSQIAEAMGITNKSGPGTASGIAYIPENVSTDGGAVPATNLEFTSIVGHEFGHLLGLDHMTVTGRTSIMEPAFAHGMSISAEESNVLKVVWQ